MAIEALIFDVDGTLADTEQAHLDAFNRAFDQHRVGWHWSKPLYRELLDITGGKERLTHYIHTLALNIGETKRLAALVPALHATKNGFYGDIVGNGGVPLRPGVERLLDEALASGCRLAIASTTSAASIDALLQATLGTSGLDRFSVIACGDQVRAKKPAPDIYRLALDNLGLHPEHAIAFEDSANGLRAAKAAGLWTVVTPCFWTDGSDFSAADLLLPNLGDPAQPLPGEPGTRLRSAAWLCFDELLRLAEARPAPAAPAAAERHP